MLTIHTITDNQIRALRSQAEALGLDYVESWCDVALGHSPYNMPRSPAEARRMILDARARCVEILNDQGQGRST